MVQEPLQEILGELAWNLQGHFVKVNAISIWVLCQFFPKNPPESGSSSAFLEKGAWSAFSQVRRCEMVVVPRTLAYAKRELSNIVLVYAIHLLAHSLIVLRAFAYAKQAFSNQSSSDT